MIENKKITKSMVDVQMVVAGRKTWGYTRILNRQYIEDVIYNKISSREIIDIAYNGLLKGYKEGYTVLYLRTGELNRGSLVGDYEHVSQEPCIVLYHLGSYDTFKTKDNEVIKDVDTLIKEGPSYGSQLNCHLIHEELDKWYLTNEERVEKNREEGEKRRKDNEIANLIFQKHEDELKRLNIILYPLISHNIWMIGLGFKKINTGESVEIIIYKELETQNVKLRIRDYKNKEFLLLNEEGNVIEISYYDRTKSDKLEKFRTLTELEKYCSNYLISNTELRLIPFTD